MDTVKFELKHPFTMEIIGPSGCGKSYLIADIIRRRREIIDCPIDKVLFIHSHYQPLYAQLHASDPSIQFSTRIQDIDEHANGDPLLVVVDDWMDQLNPRTQALEILTRYFVKSCHHMNVSIILVLQNAYRPGLRDINLNTNYLAVFGQFRDRSSMSMLARQILPGESKFLQSSYNKALDSGLHKYIFINLHPRDRNRFWVRNNIFPDSDCEVYSSE